jgi:hypothetical protein
MIKVESDLLILDSSFTKDDAKAINDFVEISTRNNTKEIIQLVRDELESMREIEDNQDYLDGLEHALVLLEGTYE